MVIDPYTTFKVGCASSRKTTNPRMHRLRSTPWESVQHSGNCSSQLRDQLQHESLCALPPFVLLACRISNLGIAHLTCSADPTRCFSFKKKMSWVLWALPHEPPLLHVTEQLHFRVRRLPTQDFLGRAPSHASKSCCAGAIELTASLVCAHKSATLSDPKFGAVSDRCSRGGDPCTPRTKSYRPGIG